MRNIFVRIFAKLYKLYPKGNKYLIQNNENYYEKKLSPQHLNHKLLSFHFNLRRLLLESLILSLTFTTWI